jgi:hypothetical protein
LEKKLSNFGGEKKGRNESKAGWKKKDKGHGECKIPSLIAGASQQSAEKNLLVEIHERGLLIYPRTLVAGEKERYSESQSLSPQRHFYHMQVRIKTLIWHNSLVLILAFGCFAVSSPVCPQHPLQGHRYFLEGAELRPHLRSFRHQRLLRLP